MFRRKIGYDITVHHTNSRYLGVEVDSLKDTGHGSFPETAERSGAVTA
jgi:hypothetical protein